MNLDEFISDPSDNVFWELSSGETQNILDEAIARIAGLQESMLVDQNHIAVCHKQYTDACELINGIDRECSLCAPYLTLPDRVQKLISNYRAEAHRKGE